MQLIMFKLVAAKATTMLNFSILLLLFAVSTAFIFLKISRFFVQIKGKITCFGHPRSGIIELIAVDAFGNSLFTATNTVVDDNGEFGMMGIINENEPFKPVLKFHDSVCVHSQLFVPGSIPIRRLMPNEVADYDHIIDIGTKDVCICKFGNLATTRKMC
ncbi:unnamed protein product [Enterobius vermicularis]|uniref:Transthyretin-like family protein n=1 Tax=Enterobius vermicularis TaxID=51028 RepID=A0A0N4VQI5_ENTVE|nr:unnamed protein product [Enterobius vermicularis]